MLVLSLVGARAADSVADLRAEFWTSSATDKSTPMVISLGGAEGPDAGGLNTIAAKPVQRVAEPDEKPTRPTPPAEKPPEMVAPSPVAKPTPKTPAKPIEKPAENVVDEEADGREGDRRRCGARRHRRRADSVRRSDDRRRWHRRRAGGRRRTSAVRPTWRRSSARSSGTGATASRSRGRTPSSSWSMRDGTITGIEVEQSAGATARYLPRNARCGSRSR